MKRLSGCLGLLCCALVALGCSDDGSGVAGSGGSAGSGGAAGAGGAAGVGGVGGGGGSGGATLPAAEFVSFSGTLGSVTDSLGGTITSSIGIDVVDPAPTWLAAWDYSSMTPLDISSVSFDSESGDYDVFLYYESSSDARNVYGRQLQQVNGTTLEVTVDGGSETVSGLSSTFLKTAADTLVMRVHFTGSATDSFSEFSIDFFTPIASMTNAFTYDVDDVDDGVVISVDTSELSAFGDSIQSALSGIGLDEDLVQAIAQALVGEVTDAVAAAEASLLVSDQDTYLGAISEVLQVVNTLTIDQMTVFNFTQPEATDRTLLVGDTGASAMTFSLNGLSVGSIENTAFLDLLGGLLSGDMGGGAGASFTPDPLTDDEISSVIELLTLSVEQGADNVDTQGTFAVQLEIGGIATENFAGPITDVSMNSE